MSDQRYSDNDVSRRDIPSFIEPRPPLIQNPFMRPKPQKGTNLLELFEEDSEIEDPELVQVYLRLKPCKVPNTLYEVRSDRCLVTSLDTATAGHGRRTQHNVSKMYTFSKIFGPECNQKEIFEQVVKENLKKLPEGHSFTLLTYGSSGSGKTYTLMGTVARPGLVPRSLEYVFRQVDAAQQPAYKPAENGAEKLNSAEQDYELQWVKRLRHVSAPLRDRYRRMSEQLHSDLTVSSIDLSSRIRHYVWVSFVEIYNEAIYDLLVPPEKRAKLRIREDSSGNVYVKGATQAFVRSGEEAYDVMVAGKHNLVVAETGVHAHSSRSHCIFTITMLTTNGEGGVRTSCVRLCDLAGCERARATRNTGTRMQESRAINSSLHVLERCLHMLRLKQRSRSDALVPYRESKLTRLLGTGLSGAKGEAVSMVVTLNPSPEYAHETKHVLGLAAVAQDIQINNTMLGITEASLESSTQETTINCSSEVMKLRTDNERLHFELVQAQARNKELMAAIEENQQETANTMRELVEEAKDMTRQYYEAQLQALRSEMDDMVEEYELRLAAKPKERPPSNAGTPSRYLQTKVAQLMTEIAVLQEQLTVERLARARAEKEVQHLRTCIEERDDVILTESDNESDEDILVSDPLNESLEPIFKKDLNKSVVKQNDTISVHTIDEENDIANKSSGTVQDIDINDDIAVKNDNHNEEDSTINDISKNDNTINEVSKDDNTINDISKNNTITNEIRRSEESDETTKNASFESTVDSANATYENSESIHNDSLGKFNDSEQNATIDVNHDQTNDLSVNNDVKNDSIQSNYVCRGTYFVSNDKLDDKDRGTYFVSNDKLDDKERVRGTYFVSNDESDDKNLNEDPEENNMTSVKDTRVSNGATLDISNNSVSKEKDVTIEVFKEPAITKPIVKRSEKAAETLVSKIIRSLKSSQGSDNSLRQFEQLELAAMQCDEEVVQNQTVFGDLKMLKEKRSYFDNEPTKQSKEITDDTHNTGNKEKRIYFDYLDSHVAASNKKINALKKIDDDRSPSIVKDNVVSDNFEPSKIKRLLGESFTKPDLLSSINKTKSAKKHESVDLFESPVVFQAKENMDNVEVTRRSIERLVLGQQSAKKGGKHNDETESVSKQNTNLSTVKENIAKSPIKTETVSIPIEKDIVKLPIKTKTVLSPMKNQKEKIIQVPIEVKKEMKLESSSFVEMTKADVKKEKLEPTSSVEEPNHTINEITNQTAKDNTIEEFENIYKDISAPRTTEFELLVSQSINETTEKQQTEKDEVKYNLRKKNFKTDESKSDKRKVEIADEILLESQAKCESKPRKRPLRLRRQKNQSDEETVNKLKDIANLQTEYSDVTMDVPAPHKAAKDIPSPEKEAEENLPPILGIQSCPAKSVTRSRRKLFTPRAEPLEESLSQTGDSNERIYVPRPSYHRPRARRKL